MTGLLLLSITACVTERISPLKVATKSERMQAYLNLAKGYLQINDFKEARVAINQAISIYPRGAEAYSLQALTYYLAGDLKTAQESYLKALRRDRNNSRIRNNYGAFLYATGAYLQARQQLLKASQDKNYSGRDRAFENLGLCELKLDNYEAASLNFARALRLNPRLTPSLLSMAKLFIAKNDPITAQSYLQRFLEISPQTPASQSIIKRINRLNQGIAAKLL